MLATAKAVVDRIRALLREEPDIALAYVFGSCGRGDAQDGSDVDVAILADGAVGLARLASFAERLQHALGGPAVDLVDLRACSPLLASEVAREGLIVLERSPEARLDFELDAVRRMEDTRWLRTVQQQLLKERVRRGRAA